MELSLSSDSIEDQRIKALGRDVEVPAGTISIDLGDVTLLPGLIDAHTHITYHFDAAGHFPPAGDDGPTGAMRYAADNARRTLESGVTTIRNLGASDASDFALRDAIRRGDLVGPDIVASGQPLTAPALRGVDGEEDRLARIRVFVRDHAREGADIIKIFEGVDQSGRPSFSSAEIAVAVQEAAHAGLKVAVHAHEAAAVKAAVEGGCASIEHGSFLDGEAIRLLAGHHTALVPTLYLPTHYLEHRNQFAFDDSTWTFFQTLRSGNRENLMRALKAGVWVVAGSDAVAGLHGHNAREVVWLVRAGMSPAEAIRAATLDAARLLGIADRVGEIAVGKRADMIAVAGDPLSDITELEQVLFVMKAGSVVKRENISQKSR